ncbi:sigma-70 family RNA polymerase sigma factor [Pseudomonas nicosulfuronedens]|uniref:Sigma-70 family RNA polymerase sigma factor n=1 Tax=Pseudomonas nicosulfuronedens TaxID=2571105 RepID=A0A5R9QU06_9PSED|nr:sigma-70 family RNA polymerase sigma factor [Pseudomonas nicosulfuronedens]MDH1010011.1 sigma-70 family RNA polymerase sigma factor [Pseudomonas nicosulfuronedens]MDH1983179.1 sigma-70 family RNA polymerase sigma factor [Pseudomonas nicosulfuronedens]MDH2030812.1 sigma-70 family RNA polymerase sigma factor [Pseudomonas nicosulfuronedens]TLX73533.1 sigma-70 family RNA polymerase sigma factor [Pseudomonas nicosulfuronedens]
MTDALSQQALHQLYSDHHGWLHQWLRRKLGCREQAADLAQDTFVRVITQRKLFELRQPRAYLTTVARSLVIDHYRRRTLEQAYLETLAALPEPVEVSPQMRCIIIETLMEIDALLDGMAARTREIFLMAQLDGLSFVEIGKRLELSANSVRKHFVRAMTHCLVLLDD